MKILFTQLRRTALTGLALAASLVVSQAQTLITTSYTNNFDKGTNTANFPSSYVYWYNYPGTGGPPTNDISMDVNNNTNSGSLLIWSPFTQSTAGISQNTFFGTFANTSGYDFNSRVDMTKYTNITFWINVDPTMIPRTNSGGTNLDYGNIGVGIINANYGYQQFGAPTIPLSASNHWVQLSVNVDLTQNFLSSVPGLAFDFSEYGNPGGYPGFGTNGQDFIFHMDSVVLHLAPFTNPPPALSLPVPALPGLNATAATITGGQPQFNRYQAATVASSGYTFEGQSSVTYSWTISSFPTGTGGNYQQHFFIVGNYPPGQFDTAADYNLPDLLWFTVQQSDAGVASMNFRMKTNEAGGNGMVFNTTPYSIVTNADSSLTTNNPNHWPIEPIAVLTNNNGAIGTWSVTIANSTNITLNGPGGISTNFNITADQAALFADPGATLILGGQPNNSNGFGKSVVYSSFSATGCATPFTDNFLADSTLDTTIWKNFSNDTNGLFLVPANGAYWIPWSVPDNGFSLQTKANLSTPGGWTLPTVPIVRVAGKDQALITTAQLPSASQGYFQLIEFQASQLQVLLAGETSAPGTLTGKTGTPTPASLNNDNGQVNVTINAVDSSFHIVPGIIDTITVTCSDTGTPILPMPAPLVNGSLTTAVLFSQTGSFTVTATDGATPPLSPGTSSSVTINP